MVQTTSPLGGLHAWPSSLGLTGCGAQYDGVHLRFNDLNLPAFHLDLVVSHETLSAMYRTQDYKERVLRVRGGRFTERDSPLALAASVCLARVASDPAVGERGAGQLGRFTFDVLPLSSALCTLLWSESCLSMCVRVGYKQTPCSQDRQVCCRSQRATP